MNLLIFGASGLTGNELVIQALNEGHQVTAYVRDPLKLKSIHKNLNVIQGDVRDIQSVKNSVIDKDVVFSTLGASSPFKFDQAVVDGIDFIVQAMEERGVKRFIYMSAINVRESRSHAGLIIKCIAPLLLRSETAGHEARESIIRKSSLDWILVRPAGLTNGNHTGNYRFGEDVNSTGISSTISRSDVADFMLKQIIDNTFIKKAPIVMY